MVNSKEHWGNVVSSLGDTETFDFEGEETGTAEPVKKRRAEKTEKKRSAKETAARKRSAKKEKAEPAEFERNLLDSLEPAEQKLDLNVCEPEKKEKKSRRRSKKAEEPGVVEQAVAAEEKKDRAKRRKLADAVLEKAKEPFRNIASQLEGRIQELEQDETETADDAEKKPKKSRKAPRRAKKSEAVQEEPAETAQPEQADFSWEIDETLEVSWGRSPKSAEPAESFADEAPEVADEAESDDQEPVKKLSRRDAEDRFASLFDENQATDDEIDDFRKRSGRSRVAKQESAEEAAPEESIDENSFWGIPDEPELGFVTAAKPSRREPEQAEPAPRAERPERRERNADAPRRERRERPERAERAEREERPPRPERRERPERSQRPEPELESEQVEVEASFPTWNDAIGDIVRNNISRHSSGRNSDRKRR